MTEEQTLLAGELALGLLDGEEKAAALRLMIGDPAFAREVERWRARFEALHAEWPEAEPGPTAERRFHKITEPRRVVGDVWRWLAVTSSVAAAALLALVVARPSPAPNAPPARGNSVPTLIAVMQPNDGAAFGALVDLNNREVRTSGGVAVPIGRQAEMWAIGRDGVPHAAGVLSSRAAARLSLRKGLTVETGMTLAISIEPIGGSPKSKPTGPVVATGKLVAL